MNTEELAKVLEQSDDFRVLRRLKGLEPNIVYKNHRCHKGHYVDCETTSLDVDKCEVIELAIYPFAFDSKGGIGCFFEPLHFYGEPSAPITDDITDITGITNDMVKGKRIDVKAVEAALEGTTLIIAHNAKYDRQVLERMSPSFAGTRWGCSMEQVPWREHRISGRRLDYILMSMGLFYDAHNALSDCTAGLRALQHRLGDRTALSYLLDAARKNTWHVWAIGAHYDLKEKFKARGYYWNNGEDGRPKAWNKDLPFDDIRAEEGWFSQNIFNKQRRPAPPRIDLVTAFERFSKRD